MKMHYRKIQFVLPVLASGALATSASGVILFSDSFNRTSGSTGANRASWGDNDNALGGSAVQTYTMDTSRGGGAQNTVEDPVAVFRNGATQINTDFAALAPEGFSVAFDFTRRPVNGFIALSSWIFEKSSPMRSSSSLMEA